MFFSVAKDHEKDSAMEKIEVIGSYIKRTSMEGPSPILVIDREQIDRSGYNSVSDVLRDLPIATSGGGRENSLSYPTSGTGTSLRGMGQSAILVLINGRRMSPLGGGYSVDLTVLPLSAIERIEILKDGASALYGSDAVGGVINVVTKKGYVGGQVNVQGTLTPRQEGLKALGTLFDFWNWHDTGASEINNSWAGKGDKLSIDASYGGNKNNIDYLVGGQVRFNSSMYLRDRTFGQPELKDYSSFGSPGSWSADGKNWNPAPGCPEERKIGEENNKFCKFNYSPYMQFMPQILQTSAFAQMDTELASGMNLMATGIYSYTRSAGVLAPPPDRFLDETNSGGEDRRIPAEIAQKWDPSLANVSQDVSLFYRIVDPTEGGGPRRSFLNAHYYQAQASLNQSFRNTLDFYAHLNVSGSHYLSKGEGYFNKKIILEKMAKGEWNPLKKPGEKDDLSDAKFQTAKAVHSNLVSVEPQLTGEISNTENNTLSFAVGSLGAWQRYSSTDDEITLAGDQWGGNVGTEGTGMRFFGGVYGELSLLSFDMLEVQLAGRTDYYHYTDAENATGFTKQPIPFTEEATIPISPRFAISFQPIEEIKLRASYGTGFIVPSMESLYQSSTVSYPGSVDYVLCPEGTEDTANKPECANAQYKTTYRSNKKLKPQTSEHFNLGIVLDPVKNFSLSLDYFQTSQRGTIGSPGLRDIFLYEGKHGAKKLKDDTDVIVNRENGDSKGRVTSLEVPSGNLGRGKLKGIDMEMAFSLPLMDAWNIGLELQHVHLLYGETQAFAKTKDFEGSKVENPIPWYSWLSKFGLDNADSDRKTNRVWPGTPRWRNRATLSFMNKDMGHGLYLTLHNIPSQLRLPAEDAVPQKDEEENQLLVPYYWQLDLTGLFTLNKQMGLMVGIHNILGAKRPENRVNFGPSFGRNSYLDTGLYSIRGRYINARLTYNFK